MEREELEKLHGKVWDTPEVQETFEIISFSAPFVAAKERATGKEGMLQFQAYPRYYFDFS